MGGVPSEEMMTRSIQNVVVAIMSFEGVDLSQEVASNPKSLNHENTNS